MSGLQPDFIDSYGKLDILDNVGDEWINLELEIREKKQEIIGIDLNTLLFGLFKLFGKQVLRKDDFSCDIVAWENIVEPAFVYLPQIVPMNDILVRILILMRKLSPETEEIVHGALEFLLFWVVQFRVFLHSQQLVLLNTFATTETGTFIGIQQECSAYGLDPRLVDRFVAKLERLRQAARSALQEHVDEQLHWDPAHDLPRTGPQLFLTEGAWDGQLKAEIKEQLKKTLTEGPKIKLEIFGGEALLDSDSDDDDDDDAPANAYGDGDDGADGATYPVVRIGPGVSLIDSVAAFAKKLLDLDPTELARQWTLLDAALFQRLRMHAILKTCVGTDEDPFAGNRLLQDTMDFGGVRRLVDRFNSASTWVTSVVLAGESPAHRGLLITKFITLAQQLQQLGNFLGLMAVLTIPVGGWLLGTIDREIARRVIAGMVVLFAGLMALGWRYPGPTRLPVSLALGGLSGVLIGATSMGGPPVILYLLAGPDPIDQTRANLIVFITLLSAVGLAILAALGVASWTDGAWCAALAPVYLGATIVGARLYGYFDERAFRRFTLIFMMVLSSALLLM